MNEEAAALARAIAQAVDGQPHATHLRLALSYGFVLTEENDEVKHYDPPATAAEVAEILPRAKAYIKELEATFGKTPKNLAEAEFEDLPDGMTAEEMGELQFLSAPPGPARLARLGLLKPDQDGEEEQAPSSPDGSLTEEEMAELQRLAVG
jgi:hypothetical protein